MKLLSLKLENIRSYTELDINFSSSTLLIGDIGSGKSTILQAVEFALFGAQRGIMDANHLLRNGCDKGQVELTFEVFDFEKKVVRVGRTLKLKRGSVSQEAGFLEINGQHEDLMPVELRSRVLTLLGYPEISTKSNSMIYRYSVYATQEQMKQIILEKPDLRMDTLRVIFGIDKYKQIAENSQFIMRQLRKKIAFFDGQIIDLTEKKGELAELKKKKEDLSERYIVLNKQVLDLGESYNVAESGYKKKEEELKSLIIKDQERKHLATRIIDMSNDIKMDTDRQKDIDDAVKSLFDEKSKIVIPKFDKSYDSVCREVSEMRELIDRNKQMKVSLGEKLEVREDAILRIEEEQIVVVKGAEDLELLKKDLDVIEKQVGEIEKELVDGVDIDKKIIEIKEKISSQKSLISISVKQKEDILKLDSCPTCKQDVDSEHKKLISSKADDVINSNNKSILDMENSLKILDEKKKILLNKEKELRELNTKKATFVERKKSLETLLESSKDKENKLKILKGEISAIKKKIEIVSKFDFYAENKKLNDLVKLENSLKEVQLLIARKDNLQRLAEDKQKSLLDVINRLDANKKALGEMQEREKYLNAELKDFEVLANKVDKMKTVAENFAKDLKVLELDLGGLEKEIGFVDSQIEKLAIEVDKKLLAKSKSDWFKSVRSWLDTFFISLMRIMETKVLEQIYMDFNRRFASWFDLLIEDEAMSVSIDENFSPKVFQNGYDIDVDSLSGGERTSVALAYRLTLNKIVNDLIGLHTKDILILDEPTEGFSSEQLDRVREVLDQLQIPQLLMVSHEEKMAGFVEEVIRVEKAGGVSGLNRV